MRRVVFQGDSITDADRDRESGRYANASKGLGSGYALLVASELLRAYPSSSLEFYNQGISGNRVVDLYARWKQDTLSFEPDCISILIGVNDTWHDKNEKIPNGVELERFELIYRLLLEWTQRVLPDTRIILCEPFFFPIGAADVSWQQEMEGRGENVRSLASSFSTDFVPFASVLQEALSKAPMEYWLYDGVHPTAAGSRLLADRLQEHIKSALDV